MRLNLTTKLLAGALALTAAGSVFANVNLANGGTGNGSLFLNVVDAAAGTSYLLDLSALNASDHLNTFVGSASQNFDLTTDANWNTFKGTVGATDELTYDVLADSSLSQQNAFTFTSNAPLGTTGGTIGGTNNTQLRNNASLDVFINAVNGSTTTSTQSLFVTTTGANANPNAYFGSFAFTGGIPPTTADVGTALSFYHLGLNGTANLNKATVTTYAGLWDLTSAGALSYTVGTIPTPLPMPLTLLLSGLALMGIIARRGKSHSSDVSFAGMAA